MKKRIRYRQVQILAQGMGPTVVDNVTETYSYDGLYVVKSGGITYRFPIREIILITETV